MITGPLFIQQAHRRDERWKKRRETVFCWEPTEAPFDRLRPPPSAAVSAPIGWAFEA